MDKTIMLGCGMFPLSIDTLLTFNRKKSFYERHINDMEKELGYTNEDLRCKLIDIECADDCPEELVKLNRRKKHYERRINEMELALEWMNADLSLVLISIETLKDKLKIS
jgi:hypothetical protein